MKTLAEFQEFVGTSTHTGEILLCMKVPVTDRVGFKSAFEEVKETTLARDGCTQVVGQGQEHFKCEALRYKSNIM